MQNLPVMLAPPPRSVPLSLRLLNIFNGFGQIGWLVFGFGMIFGWAFVGNADFSLLTFRGPHAQSAGRVTSVVPTGASVNRRRVMAHRYEFSVAGSTLHGTSYSDGESKSTGDEVTIEYDADHPERSRIAGMRRAQFGAGWRSCCSFRSSERCSSFSRWAPACGETGFCGTASWPRESSRDASAPTSSSTAIRFGR